MITILIAKDEMKFKDILMQFLKQEGYRISESNDSDTQSGIIRIIDRATEDIDSLKEKVIKLEDYLYREKSGLVYKSILEAVERPMLEHILKRTEGNQLKAARILGMNRNTIRAKIKRLGIDPKKYKS